MKITTPPTGTEMQALLMSGKHRHTNV